MSNTFWLYKHTRGKICTVSELQPFIFVIFEMENPVVLTQDSIFKREAIKKQLRFRKVDTLSNESWSIVEVQKRIDKVMELGKNY